MSFLGSLCLHSFQRCVLNTYWEPSTLLVVVLVPRLWNLGTQSLPFNLLKVVIHSFN